MTTMTSHYVTKPLQNDQRRRDTSDGMDDINE